MTAADSCSPDWSLFQIEANVPAEYLKEALQHPDAVRVAYDVGAFEMLSVALAIFGLVIAILALFGFWAIRREAISAARTAAKEALPEILKEHFKSDGAKILKSCLKDPEIIAMINESSSKLGVNESECAIDVDTDAELKETENGGHN